MASIYQPSSGRWTVQWSAGRDRNGKTVRDSRTFTSEQEAIAHKHHVETTRHGTGKDSLSARSQAWIDDRLALGHISAKTATGHREKLTAWGNLLGDGSYKNITPADLDRAFAKLAAGETPTGRTPSPRTLNHYRSVLRAFYRAMVRKREVLHNPVDGVEPPRGLKDRTKRAPTMSELQAILDAADASQAVYGQIANIIRLGAHLGLRRGELLALRWSDVDFDTMTVSITRAATQPNGRKVFFKEPKSDAGIRRVSMLDPTADMLRAQRKRVAAWRLRAGTGWADNDLVFASPLGEVLDLEMVTKTAQRIRDAAGVGADVLPLHGTRHFNITQLHKAGVDSLTIRSRAGHADIRSTQGYVTVDDDDDRKAAEALKGALL
ncbi:site-specific integrase [Ruegeria sp. AD91A]|uniref:tyrosine-type recombinase/integrase n=1 Tax=Ruegeria sp. AD91A TaxID=2293862 RepID=UPI000E48BEAA|nr:site-specific integrase [Ruegeria sp. AD91A]AXT25531.1 site-specific integrase [Ruegeria sp. AD91A]